MHKCFITKTEFPNFYALSFIFNEDLVRELKDSIPSEFRRWDPIEKRWLFSPLYLADVEAICRHYFSPESVSLDIAGGVSSSELFVQLFDLLRGEERERVYRTLAMALHPDRGGSTELMKQLNNAHDHFCNKNGEAR